MEHEVVHQHERTHNRHLHYKIYSSNNERSRNDREPCRARSRRASGHSIEPEDEPGHYYPDDERGRRRALYEPRSAPMTLIKTQQDIEVSPLTTAHRRFTVNLLSDEYDDDYRRIAHKEELQQKHRLNHPRANPTGRTRVPVEYALHGEHDACNGRSQRYFSYSQSSRELGSADTYAEYRSDDDAEFLPAFNAPRRPSPPANHEQIVNLRDFGPVRRPHGRQLALRRNVSDSNFASSMARAYSSRALGHQPSERSQMEYHGFEIYCKTPRNTRPNPRTNDGGRMLSRSQSLSIGIGRTNESSAQKSLVLPPRLRRQKSSDECHHERRRTSQTSDPFHTTETRHPSTEPRMFSLYRQLSENQFATRATSPHAPSLPRNLRRQQSENDVGRHFFAGMTRYPTTPRKGNGSNNEPLYTPSPPRKHRSFNSKRSHKIESHDPVEKLERTPSNSSLSSESDSMELSTTNEDASGQSCATPLRRKSSVTRACPDYIAPLVRHHSDSTMHTYKRKNDGESFRQIPRHNSADERPSRFQQTRGLGRQLSMVSISEDEPNWSDNEHSPERREGQRAVSYRQPRRAQAHDSPKKTVEVSPGEFTVLRGAKETWDAIQDGFVLVQRCAECQEQFCFIKDADYFLCPCCKRIGEVSPRNHDGYEGGVGLGLSTQLMKTIAKRKRKSRNVSEQIRITI